MNTGQIIKTRKENPYAQIPNEMLRDKNLSAKSKGLLSFLLSLPNDWVIYKSSLPDYFSDGKDSLRSAWDELEKYGYVLSVRMVGANGRFNGWNYMVYYEPTVKPDFGITDVGFSAIGESDTTNKEYTTKKENTTKKEILYPEQGDAPFSVMLEKLNYCLSKKFKGDSKSKRQFSARLREGYTIDDFMLAIDNAVRDEFHKESKYKYLTPEFITRPDKLEKFVNMQEEKKKTVVIDPNNKW